MNRSMARLFPGPVLVAREQCETCHGEGKVPTPEMAGWRAAVEQARADTEAEFGGAEEATYERARKIAGPTPEVTTATCKGCEGEGFKETELYLDQLAQLLSARKD
jgi:hypothetical protein